MGVGSFVQENLVMRAVSKKRQALIEAAEPWRAALRAMGRCEGCGDRDGGLEVHEICRGGLRHKALDKPFCTLLVCRACHQLLTETLSGGEAMALGLAWLRRSRPANYDAEAFYKLTGRRWPDAAMIRRWTQRLTPQP